MCLFLHLKSFIFIHLQLSIFSISICILTCVFVSVYACIFVFFFSESASFLCVCVCVFISVSIFIYVSVFVSVSVSISISKYFCFYSLYIICFIVFLFTVSFHLWCTLFILYHFLLVRLFLLPIYVYCDGRFIKLCSLCCTFGTAFNSINIPILRVKLKLKYIFQFCRDIWTIFCSYWSNGIFLILLIRIVFLFYIIFWSSDYCYLFNAYSYNEFICISYDHPVRIWSVCLSKNISSKYIMICLQFSVLVFDLFFEYQSLIIRIHRDNHSHFSYILPW